ncbi:MAG: chromosomal replication initiator protein DnaA, partial [Gammaproteobacteria bacterium]|nr:chromosomal replication initiator protein DnaA [Gammaproteobacteria bacterium]
MNWDVCVEQLAAELTAEQLNTWIKPLQVEESAQAIYLFAPNRFVKDWVA